VNPVPAKAPSRGFRLVGRDAFERAGSERGQVRTHEDATEKRRRDAGATGTANAGARIDIGGW